MFWFRSSQEPVSSAPLPKSQNKQPDDQDSAPKSPNALEPPTFGSSFLRITVESVQPAESYTTSNQNNSDQESHCWLVFTCLNSRAIHLEHCQPADSIKVLDAVARFFKLYEVPEEILFYSKHSFQSGEPDNSRIRLGQVLRSLEAVHKFRLIQNPSKPLWNNFYPMMVQTLSFALRIFDCAAASGPVESCKQKLAELINSRPILKHGNEWEVLTPEHLVTGKQYGTFPQVSLESCNELIKFWKKWSLNYLNWLKEYHQMNAYIPSAGELVLLWNSHQVAGLSKVSFNLAVIEELSRDTSTGRLTSALVRLHSGEQLVQEIQHLIPLECSQNEELLTSVLIPLEDYLDEDDMEDYFR